MTKMESSFHDHEDRDHRSTKNTDRVIINVGGIKHECYINTIKTFPDTRLYWIAETALKIKDFDPELNEFFFDRHAGCFQNILNYYRTGKLHCPNDVCGPLFQQELEFWGVDELMMEPCCWGNYTQHRDAHKNLKMFDEMVKNENDVYEDFNAKKYSYTASGWKTTIQIYRPKIWALLEKPFSSRYAQFVALFSMMVIITSITTFCMQTVPRFFKYRPVFELLEYIYCGVFTLEFLTRFACCPSYKSFFRSILTYVDFVSTIQFYIAFIMQTSTLDFLFVSRLIRIFRLFRFFKQLSGMQIIAQTLKASVVHQRKIYIFSYIKKFLILLVTLSMSNWGVDLWDNRDNIEKHTLNGIEFLDKCSSFIKDRIRIEQEYAKSLRRLVKQYQFRKKEELQFTYQESFKSFLNETDCFAGQREIIAENIQENVLNKMQKLGSDSRADRKKAISTLNDHKANLDQLQKVLQVAKKKYDQASEDASNALKAYETASNSIDLTKAQIFKFQKVSQDKGHLAEKASDEYKLATDNFNKAQTLYYEADLPNTINNELQLPEEKRIEMLKNFFIEVSCIQQKVQSVISSCLEGMVKAAEICNPAKDSLTFIDIHKTGNSVPGNIPFELWGKPNTSTVPTPIPSMKVRQKTNKSSVFAMSSKKKDVVINENVANDYSDLPPAQRRKKFNKAISTLNDQIDQLEKARAGMIKIADTSKQFGGDMASIQSQIEANSKETDRLKTLLHQYHCYISAMDPSDPKSNSRRSSTDDLPPPPVDKQFDLTERQVSPGFAGDFDDEMRCTVIYDFSGNNEGELTVYSGEELIVIEEDDGSGWTRVMRGQEEGYIPTSYVQNI